MDPRDQVSKTGIPVPARLPFGSRAFCFLLAAPARRFLASGSLHDLGVKFFDSHKEFLYHGENSFNIPSVTSIDVMHS
ncbi:hypothetical protein MITSMUL_03478 [Mitsuokella multacida DSM 20544]|uniref:Uncharacterized protein n=1 Tax=Mitsuokella multacida DSM 20544 TaxID=500635 RepID=C9KJY0_9FIRM|nr:hypothetical protein MITSMUL_03478 [Mitsuokella multacida DSM 20544]